MIFDDDKWKPEFSVNFYKEDAGAFFYSFPSKVLPSDSTDIGNYFYPPSQKVSILKRNRFPTTPNLGIRVDVYTKCSAIGCVVSGGRRRIRQKTRTRPSRTRTRHRRTSSRKTRHHRKYK
jgi:hypothetical protein